LIRNGDYFSHQEIQYELLNECFIRIKYNFRCEEFQFSGCKAEMIRSFATAVDSQFHLILWLT